MVKRVSTSVGDASRTTAGSNGDILELGEDTEPVGDMSKEPVSILFDRRSAVKKDVWEIDIIRILGIIIKILERADKKDLRVAGLVAYRSSIIYKMKVDSIFALQQVAMEKKPVPRQRQDLDINLIGIPFRHESTYPVSLDDLMGLLQNLIGSMANPSTKRRSPLVESVEPPVFEDYMIVLEREIKIYQDAIMRKIADTGRGILQEMIRDLSSIDSIRYFFAALFLAREGIVDLEQVGDDIHIMLMTTSTGGGDTSSGQAGGE